MSHFRRQFGFILLLTIAAIFAISGCRNPFVQVTIENTGTTELHNIEVDYPSASFGISSLAPGQTVHYHIQLRDNGRMKVQFFDSKTAQHSGKGPYAAEGQRGTVTITLDGTGKNTWAAHLNPAVAAPKDE